MLQHQSLQTYSTSLGPVNGERIPELLNQIRPVDSDPVHQCESSNSGSIVL